MNSEKRYYVYVWYRDDLNIPFYIGKGTGDRWKRKGKTHRNSKFFNIVNKHPCHSYVLFDNLTEEDAYKTEIETIALLKNQGYDLANLCDGGEGSSGRIITDVYREKYHYMYLGDKNPNYGNHWTEEQKKHLSNLRKRNGKSKGANNSRAKKVMCVETGKIYECQVDAAIDIGLKSTGNIAHALKSRHFLANGFHFVQGLMIEKLSDKNKRLKYLEEVKAEAVALRSNAHKKTPNIRENP